MKDYRVILVAPQNPDNIGACARAATCFGILDLRVIAPLCDWKKSEARRLATGVAAQTWDRIREHKTLEDAISDCPTSIGFTRRKGRGRKLVYFSQIESLLNPVGPTALVFGNERTGLTQAQLDACSHQAMIPVSPELESLNLSHAVAVVTARIYEHQTRSAGPQSLPLKPGDQPATSGEFEGLLSHWRETMIQAGLTLAGNPERMLLRIRKILGTRPLTSQDTKLLRGFLAKTQNAMRRVPIKPSARRENSPQSTKARKLNV